MRYCIDLKPLLSSRSSYRPIATLHREIRRECQRNPRGSAKPGIARRSSCRELPLLDQSGATVVLEDGAAAEMAVLVEEACDGGVDGSDFLKCIHVPGLRHRPLLSPERLMCVLGSIVEPAAARLSGSIADHLHRRSA